MPTDPEFLSGGGCYIFSSSTQLNTRSGQGVLKQKQKHKLLWVCYCVLLSFHSVLLSYPRAWSKITANSNAHTLTPVHMSAYTHPDTPTSQFRKLLVVKTWKSFFHVMQMMTHNIWQYFAVCHILLFMERQVEFWQISLCRSSTGIFRGWSWRNVHRMAYMLCSSALD